MEPNLTNTVDDVPFAQSVSEADIDWVLCVEINADPSFRAWLGRQVFGFEPSAHIGAWRSVTDPSLGESDIVWLVTDEGSRRHIVLIENKIDAPAQPKQLARYLERAGLYRDRGHCTEQCVVLISPGNYRSVESSDYGIRISYEVIRDHFQSTGSERGAYLASLIERALNEPRPDPDPEITAFRWSVYKLASTEFPELELEEPRPTREYWVSRSYDGFSIKYKSYKTLGTFTGSVVDLELPNAAADVERLRERHAELRSIGASVVRAGKSAAVRINVTSAQPPHFDEDATRAALDAWAALLSWWRRSGGITV